MKTIALACMLMLGSTTAYAQGLSPDSDPALLGGPPSLKPPGLGPAPADTDSSGNPILSRKAQIAPSVNSIIAASNDSVSKASRSTAIGSDAVASGDEAAVRAAHGSLAAWEQTQRVKALFADKGERK